VLVTRGPCCVALFPRQRSLTYTVTPQPANVLLDGEGHARISDMGLVRDISKSLPTSEWWVKHRAAIERVLRLPYGLATVDPAIALRFGTVIKAYGPTRPSLSFLTSNLAYTSHE